MKQKMVLLPLFLLAFVISLPISASDNDTARIKEITGVWRGTSICVKAKGNEACKDEIVIYTCTPSEKKPSAVTIKADKVINNIPETMYEIDFTYNKNTYMWEAEFKNERVHILWAYSIKGNNMTGTCIDLPSKNIRRNVIAKKD